MNKKDLLLKDYSSLFITYRGWNYTHYGDRIPMNETQLFKNTKSLLKRINREDYYAYMNYAIEWDKYSIDSKFRSCHNHIILRFNGKIDPLALISRHLKSTKDPIRIDPIEYYFDSPSKWLPMPDNSIVQIYGKYGNAHIQEIDNEVGLRNYMNKFKEGYKSLLINSYGNKYQ